MADSRHIPTQIPPPSYGDRYYDPKELRSYRRRIKKQREYQEGYRERLKAEGRPERDDVAAAWLTLTLQMWARRPDMTEAARALAKALAGKGRFSEAQSLAAIEAMVERERAKLRRGKD